jgi:GNAT superfamily N-acetyltransferase
MAQIELVREEDLDELLPLMRAYCDFYGRDPSDASLLAMSRALIADPQREGLQLIARAEERAAVGFATVFWSWSTLSAARIGVMNDLYVERRARGRGLADGLIEACAECCRRRDDVASLGWQTAKDNTRARAVYERVGATRSEWVDYSISI